MNSPQSSSNNTNVDDAYFTSSSDSLEPIHRTISPLIQWLNNNCNITDDGHPVQHIIPTVVTQNMDVLDRHRYQYRSSSRTVAVNNTAPILENSIMDAFSYTHRNLNNISLQPSTSQETIILRNNISPASTQVLTTTNITGFMGCNGHVEVNIDDHHTIGISDGDTSSVPTLPLTSSGSFNTNDHVEENINDQQTVGTSDGDNCSSTPTIPLRTQGSFKTKKYTTRKVTKNRSSTKPQKITNRQVRDSTSSYNNESSSSSSNVVQKSKTSKTYQTQSRMRSRSRVESTTSDSSDDDVDGGDWSTQSTNSSETNNAVNSGENLKNSGKNSVAVNRRKKGIDGHHFHKAIGLTLRKINEQQSITHHSVQITNDFVNDMFVRISSEASNLMRLSRKKTMTARDIQFAVKMVLPKTLADCADKAGRQALLRYANSE